MSTSELSAPEPIRLKDGAEVKTLLYIQQDRALYKVSTVYPGENRFTAAVCFDHGGFPPGRTAVRSLTREQAGHWKTASAQIISRYHAYLDDGKLA